MTKEELTLSAFSQGIQDALAHLNITRLTDTQKEVIPAMMDGRDVIVKAATASGKTFSYLIPVLERMEPQGKGKHFPVCLILVPTRELALQTASAARSLLYKTEGIRTAVLCGGEDMNRQVKMFSKGADLVIATPARLLDHIRRHTFKPKMCSMLVIDEADVMVSMGFFEDVIQISQFLNEHQTALFSATYPEELQKQCALLCTQPVMIEIKEETVHEQKIDVFYQMVQPNRKLDTAASLIHKADNPVLVFCRTRDGASFVSNELAKRNLKTAAVHSEMNPKVRRQIMQDFRNGKYDALCATGVLGRGIDIPFLNLVILYDFPENAQETIHRIGRVSRNRNASKVIFLLTPSEKRYIDTLKKILNQTVSRL